MDDSWGWEGPGDATLLKNSTHTFREYVELYSPRTTQTAVGDVSTSYLYNAGAAERIRVECPNARLIVILRNPADRAFSAYQIQRRRGLEQLTDFADALAAEPSRIANRWSYSWHYQAMGFYCSQLERYYASFPAEQIFVTSYDRFKENPAGVAQDCFRFIGVDHTFEPDTSIMHNRSGASTLPALDRTVFGDSWIRRLVRFAVPQSMRRKIGRSDAFSRLTNRGLHTDGIPSGLRQSLLRSYHDDMKAVEQLTGLRLDDDPHRKFG